MPIAPLLQRFVDDELNRATDLVARTVKTTLEQLRQPRDTSLSPSERQHYFELVQVLQQHQTQFQRSFVDTLRALVQADLSPESNGALPPGAPQAATSGLELMDETRVESDIEISRAIQQIDSAAEWELRELQTFTSTLRGQSHVTAESNPLRPQSYARALWQAAGALPVTPVQQAILLRLSTTAMAAMLRIAFAAATTRLESQGVTPGIYRTVVIAPGGGAREPEVDVTRPGALDGLMRSMPGGGASEKTGAASPRQASSTASPDLEQALRRIEALLRNAPPAGSPAPETSTLAEHRVALIATTAQTIDRQIIELLSRLFDTVLSDHSLPAGIRAVQARLQVSALRIALLDPGRLDAYDHPVWVLMDRVVGAATHYPQPDDARLRALLAFCEGLVGDMAAEPSQDAELYRRSAVRLQLFLEEQLRQQQHAFGPAIQALADAEHAEQLQRTLSIRLGEQMVSIRVSPPLRRFVTQTWARVLAESVRRFGEQGTETAGYLKTVDELLWSLKLPDHPQSRQRLVALLPSLLQRLRSGMVLIELPSAEQQAVLDELMRAHSGALRPGGRSAAAEDALSPEEIVRRMREEVADDTEDPEPQGFSDSLIDLASMETVPAALMPEVPADAPENDAANWVRKLAPGQFCRIFLHGGWTHVQLLWHSEQRHFHLFAAQAPGRTHSVTRRALERLRAANLLGPTHEHSLVQRAVDAMLRNLSHPGS